MTSFIKRPLSRGEIAGYLVLAERTRPQGPGTGPIASASTAIFHALFDLLAVRGTLCTVDMIGKGVFHGVRGPAVHPSSGAGSGRSHLVGVAASYRRP